MKTEDINALPIMAYLKEHTDKFSVYLNSDGTPHRINVLNRFTQTWHTFAKVMYDELDNPYVQRDTCFYDVSTTSSEGYCFTSSRLHKDGTIDDWSSEYALFPVGAMAKKPLKDVTPDFVEKWYAKIDGQFAKVDEYKKSRTKEMQAKWDQTRTKVLEQLEKAEKLVADAKKFFENSEPLNDYKKLRFSHEYYVKEAVKNLEFMMSHT
jgi:hypothetical protein